MRSIVIIALLATVCGASNVIHESHKLIASDPSTNARFGSSVSTYGKTMLVGAPYDAAGGAVYEMLQGDSGEWTEVSKITSVDIGANNFFGVRTSIYENFAVIGASSYGDSGGAFVFEKVDGEWVQAAKLVPSQNATQFGFAVAIRDGRVVVGAPYSRGMAGSAFVFELIDGVWSETAVLNVHDPMLMATFGVSVGLTADGVLVGSESNAEQLSNPDMKYAGLVYYFTQDSKEKWMVSQKITADDGMKSDFFGVSLSVSLDGSLLVVGANGVSTDKADWTGAVYVFAKTGEQWVQTAKLAPPEADILVSAGAYYYYGNALAISADNAMIAVGAYGDRPATTTGDYFGAVYAYTAPAGVWTEYLKGTAEKGYSYDRMGDFAVAIVGHQIAVGSDGADDLGLSMNGAVMVFDF